MCSFVAASFALFTREPEPTSDRAELVECDFTATDWTGRNLRGTTFSRCKLSGATGTPASVDGLTLIDCDLDRAALIAHLQRGAS